MREGHTDDVPEVRVAGGSAARFDLESHSLIPMPGVDLVGDRGLTLVPEEDGTKDLGLSGLASLYVVSGVEQGGRQLTEHVVAGEFWPLSWCRSVTHP